MGRGSVRRSEALLAGLFRCARCGKKLQVSYDPPKQRYVCPGPNNNRFDDKCISFGGLRSDRAVAQEILDRLQPLGIEAALAAIDNYGKEQSAKRRQLENALEQARFEATRAHRMIKWIPITAWLPVNWSGVGTRNWSMFARLKSSSLSRTENRPPSAEDRQRLLELGTDLPRAWDSMGTAVERRKRIIRLLIDEIIVDAVDDKLHTARRRCIAKALSDCTAARSFIRLDPCSECSPRSNRIDSRCTSVRLSIRPMARSGTNEACRVPSVCASANCK
jgi:hypothetical protein